MAHVAKFSASACGHVCAHYERNVKSGHYSNKNIDESRTEMNYNLGPDREKGQTEYIRGLLDEIDHVKRKDLVCMCSIVVDAPRTLSDDMHTRFFELTYDFLLDRYGTKSGFINKDDIVVSCFRHMDEATDHIHFAFVPIIMDSNGHQRICAKEVVCRSDLKTLHQDLSCYLAEHGCRADIINGNTQRDAFGRALSVRELKSRDYDRSRNRGLGRRF